MGLSRNSTTPNPNHLYHMVVVVVVVGVGVSSIGYEEIVRRGGCSYDNNETTTRAMNTQANSLKCT